MNRLYSRAGAFALSSALCLITVGRLSAQTTAAPAAAKPADEETIVLSPFVVEASEDAGYTAKDTLAGTRIRTELKDVGSSISVVTSKFLTDTNSKSINDLLVYTPSTEVAGQGGNFVGQGDGALLTNTNTSSASTTTRVRGLTDADNTRDFFLSDIPWDSYNVGRVDLQRGPNSVLFGIGSPAGIINASLNTAAFKDSNKVENQIGSFGSVRFTANFNKVLIKNELAIRVDLLRNDEKYKQDPAFKKDERIYVAGRWDPAALNNGSMRTQIRANFEKGHIEANDPVSTPPNDAITPFFTHLAKTVRPDPADPTKTKEGLDFLSVVSQASQIGNNQYIGVAGGRVFDGVVTAIDGGVAGATNITGMKNWPDPGVATPSLYTNNTGYRGIVTANQLPGPFSDIGAYKSISLRDASIFDFYNNLLDGPNKGRYNDFHAYNAALTQTFFNDKLGYELSYSKQWAKWGYHSFLATDANIITVDIMAKFVDGTINPNFGRPMTLAGGGSTQGGRTERTREVARITAFADIKFSDFTDKDSALARILGRHTFTGLYSEYKEDLSSATYKTSYLASSFAPATITGTIAAPTSVQVSQAARDNILTIYLGSKIDGNTASGLNLVGIKDVVHPPQNSTINYFNNVTNTWQTIGIQTVNNNLVDDRSKTYTQASKSKSKVNSGAFIWQGHLLDDLIVPMFGIRKDTSDFFGGVGVPALSGLGNGGLVNPYDANWKLPTTPVSVSGTSRTYSVVAHLPKSLRAKLPGNLDISPFYNKSENFQPDASRKDLFGDPIGNPSGKTREYGVTFSVLDDKLTLKIAKYKTTVTAASLGDFGWQSYLIGGAEAWAQQSAISYKKVRDTGVLDAGNRAWQGFGTTSDGHILTWRPGPAQALDGSNAAAYAANVARDPVTNPYTQAEIDATWLVENASINEWFANPVPAKFQQAWGLTDYATGGGTWKTADGITVTGDTISEGTEFELSANPIKGLDITLNASKTSAQRTNLAKTYVDWIQGRWELFKGPMGDMRIWSSAPEINVLFGSNETVRGKYGRETMAAYNLWQALQNSDVPELRPWRANLIANYTFQDGAAKGANIGGSIRWANASVTGFPVITKTDGSHAYDVTKPYKGKSEQAFDVWLGYEWKFSKKTKWRTQINVRNLFASKTLLPVTVQPDGSAAAFRIPEPRTWTLTNTLEF